MRPSTLVLLGSWVLATAAPGAKLTPGIAEFVVPLDRFPANHGSTLTVLDNGEVLACWFAGSREAGRDVRIVCSRRTAVGWGAPQTAVAPRERAQGRYWRNKFVGNPVLFRDDDGLVWLFYEAVAWGGHSGAYVDYKVSRDNGTTWSRSRRLVGSFGNFGHLPRNKPLRVAPNRFLLPVYREFLSKYGYVFDLKLKDGNIASKRRYTIPGNEHIQPTLVEKDGKVIAYLRNTEGNRVLSSRLDLEKGKWSRVTPLQLPNPGSALDAATDEAGRIVLVYNHSETSRSPLTVAVSKDGRNFEPVGNLEEGTGSFSYPAIVRDGKGDFHVTYTYNRRTIKYVKIKKERLLFTGSER